MQQVKDWKDQAAAAQSNLATTFLVFFFIVVFHFIKQQTKPNQ